MQAHKLHFYWRGGQSRIWWDSAFNIDQIWTDFRTDSGRVAEGPSGEWQLQLLVGEMGRDSRTGVHSEVGLARKVDCRLSNQEHRKGSRLSRSVDQSLQSVRVEERARPLANLSWGRAGWHIRGLHICLPAQLHLRASGGVAVPEVWPGQLLGNWGWAPVLCSHSCNK